MLIYILLTILTLSIGTLLYSYLIRPLIFLFHYWKQGIRPDYYYPLIGTLNLTMRSHSSGYQAAAFLEPLKKDPQKKYFLGNLWDSWELTLLDPEMIKEMTTIQYTKYIKDTLFAEPYTNVFGKSLLFAEGKTWKKHRDIASKYFQYDDLKRIPEVISRKTNEQFNQYINEIQQQKNEKNGQYIIIEDLVKEMQKLTADSVLKIFFTRDISSDQIDGVNIPNYLSQVFVDCAQQQFRNLTYLLFGNSILKLGITQADRNLLKYQKQLKNYFQNIIHQRQLESTNSTTNPYIYHDLLQTLLDYNQSSNSDKLSYQDIYSMFLVLFIAGMDTTAHLIAMAIYFLSINPQYLNKFREEIHTVFGADSHYYNINIEQIKQLVYTDAIINETLRLANPVIFIFPRIAIQDFQLGNVNIKKGTYLNIGIGPNGLRDELFPNPFEWNPERFINVTQKINPYSFIPFSSGPRNCIGQHFAKIETKIILVKFFSTFDVNFSKDYKLDMNLKAISEPKVPLKAFLTLRK